MKKISLAIVAALAISGTAANAATGSVSLDMTVTTQVQGDVGCIESFDLNWITSTVGCGVWAFVPNTNNRWYDNQANCPTPNPAEANLTESPCAGETNFSFHLNITDDASGNNGYVTVNNLDPAGGWITLYLTTKVDGRAYSLGDPIAPLTGITSFIKIIPTLASSSSAGCYNFGTDSTPAGQTSCGHAMTGPTPGAAVGTTGQPGGHYSGTALVIVYI